MKQSIIITGIRKLIVWSTLMLLILGAFTGFKPPMKYASRHSRNGTPTVYMVYQSGPQNLPTSYTKPIYEIECVGDGWLCAIYVEDFNLDGDISIGELIHFIAEYDSNANGSLHDEAYIPGVLIKKSM